jgi:hypothetical protein
MRMRYSASSLDVAELDWIGGTRAENERLTHAKTRLMLLFAGAQYQGEMTWRRPGGFSHWVKSVMLEFVRAQCDGYKAEQDYMAWDDLDRESWPEQDPRFLSASGGGSQHPYLWNLGLIFTTT